jgi:hypothetical protein
MLCDVSMLTSIVVGANLGAHFTIIINFYFSYYR